MKYLTLISLSLLVVFTSCERRLNHALKSSDKNAIFKLAEEYENRKKYSQAISLYDQVTKLVVGTDEAPEVAYRTARLNYLDKNYRLAAHQYKNFASSYPKDLRVDDAVYMIAYCYYLDSPDYNLDQTNTYDALKELQAYIDTYPNSPKVSDCNRMISELNRKLEKKAFENAKTLYKITEYKGAIISFQNLLDDYPETKLREKILIYLLRAETELAVNSIYKLKKERINNALQTYNELIKSYPSSEYIEEAQKLKNKLSDTQENYNSIEKENNKSNSSIKTDKRKIS